MQRFRLEHIQCLSGFHTILTTDNDGEYIRFSEVQHLTRSALFAEVARLRAENRKLKVLNVRYRGIIKEFAGKLARIAKGDRLHAMLFEALEKLRYLTADFASRLVHKPNCRIMSGQVGVSCDCGASNLLEVREKVNNTYWEARGAIEAFNKEK